MVRNLPYNKIAALILLLCGSLSLNAQVPDGSWEWAWMHGRNTNVNNYCVYGVQGVADPANMPGGRSGSASWKDTSGNFWVFGGGGHAQSTAGMLNDLWKYNPLTNEWAWMKGSQISNPPGFRGTQGLSHPDNVPGGRNSSASWVDNDGNFWLFGGFGYCLNFSGALADLWKYDIATNEWTWIKGDTLPNRLGVYGTRLVPDPGNRPSGRYGMAYWTDQAGNFWMMGGTARFRTSTGSNDQAELNDLWRYNPVSNEWTWMHGDTVRVPPAITGIQGTPAPANTPTGLSLTAYWTDHAGDFWLYGGTHYSGLRYMFSDLWKFSPATNMWTWVKGTAVSNQVPVYGTTGIGNPANTPGARELSPATWTDRAGNLWLMAGEGRNGIHNDLWKYDPVSNEWTWVKGDNTTVFTTTLGVYGTRLVGDPANKPGHRDHGPVTWIDGNGLLWLLGGRTNGAGSGDLNDLWRLAPPCVLLADPDPISGPDSICLGQEIQFRIPGVPGALAYHWSWPQGWGAVVNDSLLTVTADNTGGTIRVFATNSCDTTEERLIDVVVLDPIPVEITVDHDTLGTLNVHASYQWYRDGVAIPGADTRNLTITENALYSVKVYDGAGCSDSASYNVTSFLSGLEAHTILSVDDLLRIWPNPVRDYLYIESPVPLDVLIHSVDGRLLGRHRMQDGAIDLSGLPAGVYMLYAIQENGGRIAGRRLLKS